MKDWKTWAIFALALWCAFITTFLLNRSVNERRAGRESTLRIYASMKKYGSRMTINGVSYTFDTARKNGIITDDDLRDMEELERKKNEVKNVE